jgi:hypothetical protein
LGTGTEVGGREADFVGGRLSDQVGFASTEDEPSWPDVPEPLVPVGLVTVAPPLVAPLVGAGEPVDPAQPASIINVKTTPRVPEARNFFMNV